MANLPPSRFDAIESRLAEIEKKLGSVERIEGQLEQLEDRLVKHQEWTVRAADKLMERIDDSIRAGDIQELDIDYLSFAVRELQRLVCPKIFRDLSDIRRIVPLNIKSPVLDPLDNRRLSKKRT